MNLNAVHISWMQKALKLAMQASHPDEVPVGAILVKNNKQIAAAKNATIRLKDPTAHAEMLVLREATAHLNHHYLHNTTLYITLEPCLMCLGAIIQLQVQCIVFGAYDPKRGAAGSTMDILQMQSVPWQPDVWGGVCSTQSCQLLRNFFKQQRDRMLPT